MAEGITEELRVILRKHRELSVLCSGEVIGFATIIEKIGLMA
jgi:hypothetical protein